MNQDIQKIDRLLSSPLFRRVLPIIVVIEYIIGLFLMFVQHFSQGLSLWFLSTVLGALLLYVKRTQEKKKADLLQAEEDERQYQENLKNGENN